jgi:hypothetical protein
MVVDPWSMVDGWYISMYRCIYIYIIHKYINIFIHNIFIHSILTFWSVPLLLNSTFYTVDYREKEAEDKDEAYQKR